MYADLTKQRGTPRMYAALALVVAKKYFKFLVAFVVNTETCANIRSFLPTARKQNFNLPEVPTQAFSGRLPVFFELPE